MLIQRTIPISLALLVVLFLPGCGLFPIQSYSLRTEPTGGYQFEHPENWRLAKPPVDMNEADEITYGYTTFVVPQISPENSMVNVFVVDSTVGPQDAMEKYINAIDWDNALVTRAAPYKGTKTKIPTTSITVQSGEYVVEWLAFTLDEDSYALVTYRDTAEIQREERRELYADGIKKMISSFRVLQ